MAEKTGVAHVDKIAEQYDEYLRLRDKHLPRAEHPPIQFHEMISPDGGWYAELYKWDNE